MLISGTDIGILSASFIAILFAVCKTLRMSRCIDIDLCCGCIKLKRDVLDKEELALELKTGEP